MFQIKQLLKFLNLNEENRVLDLGCGNGFITEYIQDQTKSYVTGIELSPIAIGRAINRTYVKPHKRKFEIGDMNNLQFKPNSFDTAILIDTHYFLDDFVVRLFFWCC